MVFRRDQIYRVRLLNSLSEILVNQVYKASQTRSRVINNATDAINLVPTKGHQMERGGSLLNVIGLVFEKVLKWLQVYFKQNFISHNHYLKPHLAPCISPNFQVYSSSIEIKERTHSLHQLSSILNSNHGNDGNNGNDYPQCSTNLTL